MSGELIYAEIVSPEVYVAQDCNTCLHERLPESDIRCVICSEKVEHDDGNISCWQPKGVEQVTTDKEAYSRREAECERQARAEDAVTDEAIGEYIREELLDEMSVEIADDRSGFVLAHFCEDYAPKTYEKARTALIERAMEVGR